MRTLMLAGALICLGTFDAALAAPAAPVHVYEFDNTLADSLGGPALQSLGGTLGAGSYTFGAGQGLILDGALGNGADYSIEITAHLDQVSEYRRIVDFKDGGSDTGLYSFAGRLSFAPIIFGTDTVISSGDPVTMLLTRNAGTNVLSGYANGVAQFSIVDGPGNGIFSNPGARMVFFRDDNVFPGEQSSGAVTSIRVFDRGLSPTEVVALYAPIPEPGTWALTLAGLGLLGWAARRRRAAAPTTC
jgi:hypothetical protein